MDLTDTTLSALRAKAEEATPGPWTVVRDPVKHWPAWVEGPSTHPSIPSPDVVCSPSYSDRFSEDDVKNMEYIAAANPTTILALLDALEEARAAYKKPLRVAPKLLPRP